jgi:predicted alpha/beta superfamily hydrolase
LKHPDVFGKAGVFSSSFWTSDDIYTLTEQTTHVKSKIYLLCGDAESDHLVAEVNRMDKLLETHMQSAKKVLKIVPGGKHNEAFWKSEFGEPYSGCLTINRMTLNSSHLIMIPLQKSNDEQ